MVPGLVSTGAAAPPTSQVEKESYSIGYQIGVSMKNDGIEVDFDRLLQGMQDSLGDKTPLLSEDEMRQLIVERRKLARDMQMRKMQEQLVSNTQESQAFLEENKQKEGVRTTDSGLQYKVIKEGNGAIPQPGDFVNVDYRGTFIDGQEFDSSYAKGEPIHIQTDTVIKGWTEALGMMKTGSKWQLFVPPELAYGRRGMPGRIPPNKALMFEMELLSIDKGDQAMAAAPKTAALRNMTIMGQIAKSANGYIIRGQKPAEIFTILNAAPQKLDQLTASEKTVTIQARIVSGDNVEIETIDGRAY